MSVAEQRYQAVLAVISGGETVNDTAARFGVSRQTVHAWLSKYEAGGIENLGDGSHRPRSCPHQMPAAVEVAVAELRRAHPTWGPNGWCMSSGRSGDRGHACATGAVGVGGVSGVGPVVVDRAWGAAAAGPQVEAVGTWPADGTVADGRGRRVRAGRRAPARPVTDLVGRDQARPRLSCGAISAQEKALISDLPAAPAMLAFDGDTALGLVLYPFLWPAVGLTGSTWRSCSSRKLTSAVASASGDLWVADGLSKLDEVVSVARGWDCDGHRSV